jgi:hypothetical protein
MPVDPKLTELANARAAITAAENEAGAIAARMVQVQRELELATRRGDQGGVEAAQSELAQLAASRAAAKSKAVEAGKRVEQLRAGLTAPAGPGDGLARLAVPPVFPPVNPEIPLLLLPVRLETRFRTVPGGTDLLIRIYPDDLHVDTHEPSLTDNEVGAARQYWEQIWRSGTADASASQTRERSAWSQLADRFGAPRAAWIARALEPRNVTARPVPATPEGAPFSVDPDFPNPPRREASWTRAARATLLPDRWVAIGYGPAGPPGRLFVHAGALIPDLLAVGPAPDEDTAPPPNAASMDPIELMDEGMRWLVDFEHAVRIGMGLRIRMPAGVVTLNRLIVFGIKASMDHEDAAARLSGLVEAHHYTRALSFIPAGTATNNTPEVTSGYDSADLGHERSFAAERKAPLFAAGNRTSGDLAARALGIDPSVFSHVAWSGTEEDVAARHMNAALWGATWGYFLDKRLAGTVTPEELRFFRRHFIDYVRGAGPLPSMRIGKQPYGLLPVTSLDRWRQADIPEVSSRATLALINVRESFRRAVPSVPRVDNTAPDQDLLSVLRMSPVSSAYSVRNGLGPNFVDNYWSFVGTNLDANWWTAQQHLASPPAIIPGMPTLNPQSTAILAPHTNPLQLPLVQADGSATASPDAPPEPNYLKALASATQSQLRADTTAPEGSKSLLYRILRHSLLQEYATASFRIHVRTGIMTAADREEPEFVDLNPALPPTRTIWRQMATAAAAVTGAQEIGPFLDNPVQESNEDVRDLGEVRASLRYLGGQSVKSLEQLLPSALDTCSHRLDAWITSLATKRLDAVRSKNPRGVFVGGFGWVEDLSVETTPASEGYMHTPSLAHGTAAALLGSAYLSHRNQTGPNPFAINISSDRVRMARSLVQGVRQGQPLAALLGYRLERALQEQKLAVYIARFRKIAPFGGATPASDEAIESVAANNVVHGLRILSMWKGKHPGFQSLRTTLNIADFVRIDRIFQELDETSDALGDILLAESVYQAARNDLSRAGLSVEAIAQGQPVPQPEIIDTPRTGATASHRVMMFCGANTTEVAAWPVNNSQVRATVEPRLNAMAAWLLPDPARIRCRAEYVDAKTRQVLKPSSGSPTREIRLTSLQLSPLDAIYITSSRNTTERGEIEQRLVWFLMRNRPAGIPIEAEVRLDYGRDSNWTPDIVSFSEFQEIVSSARLVLTAARAIGPADLASPQEAPAARPDTAEFTQRVELAVAALRRTRTSLTSLLANPAVPPQTCREVMLRMAHLGFQTAIPLSVAADTDADRKVLLEQAAVLSTDVAGRLQKLDAATAGFSRTTATPQAQIAGRCIRFDSFLGGTAAAERYRGRATARHSC